MALILHELATNAVKHGALSGPNGRVKVSWSRPSPGQLRFVWEESGGPRTRRPTTRGFGLTVLQTAAADLGAVANYDFRSQGFLYTLQGPFELVQSTAVVFPFTRQQDPAPKAPGAPCLPHTRCRRRGPRSLSSSRTISSRLAIRGYRAGAGKIPSHELMLASYEEIDAALLDVSLGRSETSAAIADQLLARNIPLALPPDTPGRRHVPLNIFARFRS